MFSFAELEGRRIKLVPMEQEHVQPLFEAARFPEIWDQYPIRIRTMEDMRSFIRKALDGRERKEQFPYVVYDKVLHQYVGSTRYLRISEEHHNLNIGSTWYSPHVWRSRVNTETKYLLLKYAFETLKINRVEIITTTENHNSQRAIERLGATKEGILRKKYHGLDYVFYSIIDSDWAEVKSKLEGFLDDSRYDNHNGDDMK
ncbi:GNAT family N-acetyltransferase [Cohnella caldifontis]|uniref:GNAT family N-acetyltransferase n=1 Tax=Cohnella caldifontis TaxID=3027471 RepID=UPI0023EB5FBA|nr:GNAT family N-acetyltransferase [Cohnella sp. YIM B05605]